MDAFYSRRAYVALFCGVLLLVMALTGTFMGKLPGRFGEGASRSKSPGQYWLALAVYYVASIGFLSYYLHEVHAFSN